MPDRELLQAGFSGFLDSITVNDGSGDGNLFAPVSFGGEIEVGLALFFWTLVVGVAVVTSLVAFCLLELPEPGVKPGKSNSCFLPWSIVGFLLGYVLLSWRDGQPVGYLSYFVERHDLLAVPFAGKSFFELQTLLRGLKLLVTTTTMFAMSISFTYITGGRVVLVGGGQSLGNSALSYALTIFAGIATGFACRYTLIASQHHGSVVQSLSAAYLFLITCATLYTAFWMVNEKIIISGVIVTDNAVLEYFTDWGYTLAIVFVAQQPIFITIQYFLGHWLYSSSRKVYEMDKLLFSSEWWRDFRTREAARKFKKGGLARLLRRGGKVASGDGGEEDDGADLEAGEEGSAARSGLASGIAIRKLKAKSFREVRPATPPIVITEEERQIWYHSGSDVEELSLPPF